jgi:hypothetical protein
MFLTTNAEKHGILNVKDDSPSFFSLSLAKSVGGKFPPPLLYINNCYNNWFLISG